MTSLRFFVMATILTAVFSHPPHYRYTPMTVHNVQIMEVKATELNFTLAPVVSDTAGSTTTATSSSTNKPNGVATTSTASTVDFAQTPRVPSETTPPVLPPEHQPIQPQEFRHHNYADMDLFLRKYSSEFPSIAHLYSVGHSVEDRELQVMVISDNPTVHEHGMP